MKKHPVDDRFARKLRELSVTPSGEAWERIRTAQVKRKPLWLRKQMWFAAACSLLTFQTAYWVWSSYEWKKVQVVPKLVSVNKKEESIRKGTIDSNDSRRGDKLSFGQTIETLKVQNSSLTKNSYEVPVETVAEMNQIQKEAPLPLGQIKEDTAGRTMDDQLASAQEAVPDLPAKELAEVKPSPPVNSRESDRVVIVHVTPREEEIQPSRFQRVLRQLKNAKQGDPVAWEELGLNPKKLFVRDDSRKEENSK